MKVYRLSKIIQFVFVASLLYGIYEISTIFTYEELHVIAAEHRLLGAVSLSVLMFCTTVAAPLTSLPLVPVLAPLLGPFTTGVACYVGWVLGAMVSFWIGRTFGQPFLDRYIDMTSIRRYEKFIRPDHDLVYLTLLRMILPVDIISYAIGIFSSVSVRIYTYSTLLGILWFSFALPYAVNAVHTDSYVLLTNIGVASVVILYFSWKYARRILNNKP